MGTYTIQRDVELITIECPDCTAVYAISKSYQEEGRRLGHFKHCWTCPYCKCSRGYGEGEADKLRVELSDAQAKLTRAKCEMVLETNKRIAIEADFRQHQKRIKNGICPCCHRSFANLKAHIKTKHPGFPDRGKK